MRFVDRAKVKSPLSLADTDSTAAKERIKAAEHYAALQERAATLNDPECSEAEVEVRQPEEASDVIGRRKNSTSKKAKKRSFLFQAYKAEDVKFALDDLFHGKCAYCESQCRHVTSMHVEHFRPKQRIAGDPEHLGYWWLASSWENLLPACPLCNSGEYHPVFLLDDEPAYSQPSNERGHRIGKLDHFPINGVRATQQSQLAAEDPLLIDPTVTDPAKHLTWISTDLSLITAARGDDGVPDKRGFSTYRILGLNRQSLVEMRTGVMIRLKDDLQRIERDALRAIQTSDSSMRHDLLQDITTGLDRVKCYAMPEQPYSMMAKALLEEKLAQLEAKLEEIKLAVIDNQTRT